MRRHLIATAAAAATLILTATTACTRQEGAQACVDWATFPTPTDAATASSVVVRAHIVEQAGTATLFGADATVWALDVAAVLADNENDTDNPTGTAAPIAAGSRIEVVSTPVTCTSGDIYPDGDPLDVAAPVIVFIERDAEHDRLRTITPDAGITTPAPDGGIPDAW